MSTQQLQAPAPLRRSSAFVWWLLGFGLVVLVAGLVIFYVSQRTPTPTSANSTKVGSTQAPQPDASAFGVARADDTGRYGPVPLPFGPEIAASYGKSGQTVPDAATQGTASYIQ